MTEWGKGEPKGAKGEGNQKGGGSESRTKSGKMEKWKSAKRKYAVKKRKNKGQSIEL
jgi:hypothetical protein